MFICKNILRLFVAFFVFGLCQVSMCAGGYLRTEDAWVFGVSPHVLKCYRNSLSPDERALFDQKVGAVVVRVVEDLKKDNPQADEEFDRAVEWLDGDFVRVVERGGPTDADVERWVDGCAKLLKKSVEKFAKRALRQIREDSKEESLPGPAKLAGVFEFCAPENKDLARCVLKKSEQETTTKTSSGESDCFGLGLIFGDK